VKFNVVNWLTILNISKLLYRTKNAKHNLSKRPGPRSNCACIYFVWYRVNTCAGDRQCPSLVPPQFSWVRQRMFGFYAGSKRWPHKPNTDGSSHGSGAHITDDSNRCTTLHITHDSDRFTNCDWIANHHHYKILGAALLTR
jgi:hypothetical protein